MTTEVTIPDAGYIKLVAVTLNTEDGSEVRVSKFVDYHAMYNRIVTLAADASGTIEINAAFRKAFKEFGFGDVSELWLARAYEVIVQLVDADKKKERTSTTADGAEPTDSESPVNSTTRLPA